MLRKIAMCAVATVGLMLLGGLFWPRSQPNLVLITLDTTRADRLGCYGYAGAQTPVLDSLASSGALCEQAYTVAPLTLPAHTSLFTGLYPAESGVRTNGRGRLDHSIPTLAETLKRRGYETGAFVAAFVLDKKFGLERGFDTYDDDVGDVDDDSDSDVLHRHRSGMVVVDAALNWLRRPFAKPFFCWVHLYDPHAPYSQHADLFGDKFAEQPYDAEIAYVDQQVGRLMDSLKSLKLDSRTLVVIVGDHGEGLGEHIERTHGLTLYNATMHVPLIFHRPAQIPAGRRISAAVPMIDISPTILELLGIHDERKITGKSIMPWILANSSASTDLDRSCYGATDDPFLINGWSPLRSLTKGNWKYIQTTRPELYDLATDPHERHNLIEIDLDQARSMASRLSEFETELITREETKVQLSAADRRALASLGYVAGATVTVDGTPPASLPDVKDMLGFYMAAEEAEKLIHHGDHQAGVEQLRNIVKLAPTHTTANWSLAWTLWEDSKNDEAKQDEAMNVFRDLLAIRPGCHEAHQGLGMMLITRNRPDDGIAELRKALEILPELSEANYILAKALFNKGRIQEAMTHFDAVLKSDPRHSPAYQWRAHLRTKLGQPEDAIADYRKAVQYAPDSPESNFNLGIVLADQGKPAEARQYLTRAVELNPRGAQLQYYLGMFLSRQHDFQEAVTHLSKALELQPDNAQAEAGLHAAQRELAGQRAKSN